MRNRDIIVHGLQSIDSPIGSNCVNIAHEFAKNNRVLYVNYPLDRLTKFRRKHDPLIQKRIDILNGKQEYLQQISDNMFTLYPKTLLESISQISFVPLFKALNNINSKRYAKKVQEAIDKLGFKDYIIFNDSDFYRAYNFIDHLDPAVSVYYTRDNMRATHFFRKHGAKFENEVMAKSDLVTANSTYLRDIAAEFNPKSFYVGQGCDLSLFNRDLIEKLPDDVAAIKGPRIGYIGALKSSRLSIEIIKHIAISRSDWSVVLVGPEDDAFKNSDLHSIPNVYFLGSKKMEELPAYTEAFDVTLNPQALNPLTIGNYPRKIDEYLAMGKPVVATLTETMKVFQEYTYLAEDKEGYVELIDKALKENNEDRAKARIAFAKSHTWENNVNEIYKVIENQSN